MGGWLFGRAGLLLWVLPDHALCSTVAVLGCARRWKRGVPDSQQVVSWCCGELRCVCVGSDCELLSRSWIAFFFGAPDGCRAYTKYNGKCRIARMPRVTCGRTASAGTFIQPSRGRLLDVEAFLSHAVRFLYFTFCTLPVDCATRSVWTTP